MDCPLYTCKSVERKRKEETHAGSPTSSPRVGSGVAWRRMHDMRVNDLPKSGSNPCRNAASFCSLFLLHVQCVLIERPSWLELNPSRFSSTNTCDCHITSNSIHEPTNAPRFSPPSLLCHQDYFIPIIGVHLRPGEQVSGPHVHLRPSKQVFETVVFSDLAPRQGE
jgi:hypothetical protein